VKHMLGEKRGENISAYSPAVETELEARLLWLIREGDHITRSELMRRTGLSRGTIVSRIKTLEAKGLVETVGKNSQRVGRPSRALRYKKEAGHIVAVDLGATSLTIGIANLNAEILYSRELQCDVTKGPAVILPVIVDSVRRSLWELELVPSQVKGLGMGVPGPVEFASGKPVTPPIMGGWHLFPIREYLESALGCPVYVDNDVNIMALGEKWSGLGKNVDNFIFVKVGTGIGCGIVCRGEIYRGEDGCAGDIGHIQVTNSESIICRCGNIGCLEAVAGGAALEKLATEAAVNGKSHVLSEIMKAKGYVKCEDIGIALSHGDPYAVEIVRSAGQLLGQTLASIVNFFNPALIVIGGGVANLGDLFLACVREAIYRRSLPLATRNVRIKRSILDGQAGIIGAAVLVLEELYLQKWPYVMRG